MKKHLDQALKEIKFAQEWEKDIADIEIKFWLGHMYRQGYIEALKWSMENKKKYDR